MGEYLTIIWDAETPSAAEVPWDNCLGVVHASDASLTESTILATNADDWSSVMANAGFSSSSNAYKSVAQFFAASPTPGSTLYVLALASGAVQQYNDAVLLKITTSLYETPLKPPLGFIGPEAVKYFPDKDKSGYFVNRADGSLGVSDGFTVLNDGFGKWTGQLNFPNGLSGFQVDNPILTDSKITVSFRIGKATADVSEAIENYNINMMAVAYENTKTKTCYSTSNTYYGTLLNDLSRFSNAIAGKNCIWFFALPGNVNPTESGCGLSVNWSNMRNVIGQREDFSAIKARPSDLGHDMAYGYMGMTAGTHPHTTMTFAAPHMGIQEEESQIRRNYWNDGQIASPMTRRELAGNPFLISHGFTFGTGYSSRINYVRCKYIIAQNLVNGIWALFASRTVRMSYSGMQLVKNKISGIFKTLQDQGIHDGLAYIKIPIEIDLKNNTAAGQAARAARTIPSIEIGFYWYSSLEKIIITGIRNEA